ncbi:hypothetical protein [Arthrobacter globiformis]
METTDLSIDQVAVRCGFASAVTQRQNFSTGFSATPTEYSRFFDT